MTEKTNEVPEKATQPELITTTGEPSREVIAARILAQLEKEKEEIEKSKKEREKIASLAEERHRNHAP